MIRYRMTAQYTYRWITILMLSFIVAFPAVAASGRNVITATQVATAISELGMAVSAQQITLLTDAVTTSVAPSLKVQSMEPWGDRRMKVRMGCARLDQCLPFYVAVSRDRQSTANAATPLTAVSPSSPVTASAGRSSMENPPRTPRAANIVLKSGAPAVLLLDGNHVHIQLVVVCLEDGAVGQTIRVASKDHRQRYTAEVCNGGVLKGRL